MTPEWSEWHTHTGGTCPFIGKWVRVKYRNGQIDEGRATGLRNDSGSAWEWSSLPDVWMAYAIVTYQIRKPRGLAVLEKVLADLPEKVDA